MSVGENWVEILIFLIFDISRLIQAIMSDIQCDKPADGSGNGFLSVTAQTGWGLKSPVLTPIRRFDSFRSNELPHGELIP